jgi:hypothetical protein
MVICRLAVKSEKISQVAPGKKLKSDKQNINLLVIGPGLVGVEGFPFLLVLVLSHGTVFFLLLLFLPQKAHCKLNVNIIV